jgi:hypothetical protein
MRKELFKLLVEIQPFRSTSGLPTQISGLPTYEENTIHPSQKSACNIGQRQDSQLMSGLPMCAWAKGLAPGRLTHAGTANVSAQPMRARNRLAWRRDSRRVRMHRPQYQDSRLMLGLPTTKVTAQLLGLPTHVGTSDNNRPKNYSTWSWSARVPFLWFSFNTWALYLPQTN